MKVLPWLISVTVHGLLLLIGGLSLQEAIVGIAPGRNSIQVNLVASPSDPTPVSTDTPPPASEAPVMPPLEPPLPPTAEMTPVTPPVEPLPMSEMKPEIPPLPSFVSPSAAPSVPSALPHATAKVPPSHSHASATGKDSVTEQSVAGAIIDEEPDYLSNPAPVYPQAARDNSEEGVVTLDVLVNTDGNAETVKVSSSSGYHLLDDSARDAVKHYRFRPAMLGGMRVRSHVKVPIRFRLDE